jgi:hypothetical protein
MLVPAVVKKRVGLLLRRVDRRRRSILPYLADIIDKQRGIEYFLGRMCENIHVRANHKYQLHMPDAFLTNRCE